MMTLYYFIYLCVYCSYWGQFTLTPSRLEAEYILLQDEVLFPERDIFYPPPTRGIIHNTINTILHDVISIPYFVVSISKIHMLQNRIGERSSHYLIYSWSNHRSILGQAYINTGAIF